jgi:hypothetical protein
MIFNEEQLSENLSIRITNYDCELSTFRQRRYIHIVLALTGFILGIIGVGTVISYILFTVALYLFVRRQTQQKKYYTEKGNLNNELDELRSEISVDKYFELKERIVEAGR